MTIIDGHVEQKWNKIKGNKQNKKMLTLTNMTSLFYFFHSTKFVQIPASAVWKIWRTLSGLNLAISRKI